MSEMPGVQLASLPVERGIAADSPPLWNKCYEPLMNVVCSCSLCQEGTWRTKKQFCGGFKELFKKVKEMDESSLQWKRFVLRPQRPCTSFCGACFTETGAI